MAKKKTAILKFGALKACSYLAVIYILEELFLPVNQASVNSYSMSRLDYRLATIISKLPVILVWFVAFWGYSKLTQYSKVLGKAPEAQGYHKLSQGLAWLAWSLPVSSIVDRFLSGLSNHQPKLDSTMTIISNYFDLILPFIAFIIIASAAKALVASQKWSLKQPSLAIMSFSLAGAAVYCYLVLKSFKLSGLSGSNNIYHLPAWLAILSLLIPYLYAWLMGLLAAYELSLFSIKMPGVLYRKALALLVYGLVAIVSSFIVSQYLSAVWPASSHLVFNYHLLVTTFIRVISGIGFLLLAIGANKLKMIEEV